MNAHVATSVIDSRSETFCEPRVAVDEAKFSVSERIRARLETSKSRFYANDNIADFIRPGELITLEAEVAEKVEAVLRALVIDTRRDHNTQDTAKRVAKMYVKEVFAGRYQAAPNVTEFPNITSQSDLILVGPIAIRSACSHHFCPIIGKVWLGILPDPDEALIGLSKYARLTEWVMTRPQIQEEAIVQLADQLMQRLRPKGLAIVMQAEHFCMSWRGVKDSESIMISRVMRGAFGTDPALRSEFLAMIK